MTVATKLAIFTALLSAVLVMVEKFSVDLVEPVTFDNLTSEIKQWHSKGVMHLVNGHKMFVVDEGKGPETIILVHGFPCSSYDYHRAWDELTKEFRVVAFDQLGFGFSDKPNETYVYSMADQAEMALALWRQLGIESAHIVAHDMGDSVVTEIMARKSNGVLPEYFDKFFKSITFSNGGMVYELINFRFGQKVLTTPKLGPFYASLVKKLPFGIAESIFKAQLGSVWSPNYDNAEQKDTDIHEMALLFHLNGGINIVHKTCSYLIDRSRFEPRWLPSLSHLDVPIMLLWGDSDSVAPMDIPKALITKNYIPKDKFVGKTMKNVGHFLMLESPSAWAATVTEFVKSSTKR